MLFMVAYMLSMRKDIASISVFFPAYNEEENLSKTVENAASVLKEITKDWEILIINDGSHDGTEEVANKLRKQDKRVRVISHRTNKGYGEALKTGFKNAKYPWVAFSDSDGQFNFSEIGKLLEHREEADFILGYRIHRADPFVRSLGTWVWTIVAKVLMGLPARDYSCGFKLIKKEAYEKVLPLTAGEKVTQIEMLVKAKRLGLKFKEVGVHHYPRKFGTQTGANIKVVLKSFIDLFRLWWKLLAKLEFFTVFSILAVAGFLRLYRISEYLTFLGDEGRDAIVVRRLLVDFDPILIGPGTSIGNMYLGPLYYYMMAPAQLLSGLSPVGPAVMVAILSIVTVWLTFKIAKDWFGSLAGVVAAALYAVSPVVIVHSHSSWNPNIMPFFALLSVYSIWRVWKKHELKWLLVLGISFAFALQSHYLGLLLAPTLGLFWLLALLVTRNKRQETKRFFRLSFISLLIFAFLMSPLVIFDARHDWRNFESMKLFFTHRQETVSARPWNALPQILPLFEQVSTRLVGATDALAGKIIMVTSLLGLIWLSFKKRARFISSETNLFISSSIFILTTWLVVSLMGMALLKQNIYDHYFGFVFTAPFILIGAVAQEIFSENRMLKYLTSVSVILLICLALWATPIKNQPQRQLQRTEEIAKKISDESGGKPFNLAVLAERNYEDAYQYFLEWWRTSVRDIDPLQYEKTVADQLFVVCELPVEKCDPTHSSKAEVANFGWSKIDQEWDINGIKLYKLTHSR